MGLVDLINFPPPEVEFRLLLVDDGSQSLLRLVCQQEGEIVVGCCFVFIVPEQQGQVKEYVEKHPELDLILLNGTASYCPDLPTAVSEYCRMLSVYNPFCRLFVFVPLEAAYRPRDLEDRGAAAVFSLDTRGWQEFAKQLDDAWFPRREVKAAPEILCDELRELSDDEKQALQTLFPNSQRLDVTVYNRGYSDTQKFRVSTEGRAYFIKLGRIDLLEREYRNFLDLVADRVPHFSVSLTAPQQLGMVGLLKMALIGGAGGNVVSFEQFLLEEELEKAFDIIDELFASHQQLQDSLQISREDFSPHYYLRVLPPLLELQFCDFSSQLTLEPDDKTFLPADWDPGELHRHLRLFLATLGEAPGRYILQDLYVEEVRLDSNSKGWTLQLTNEERWLKINVRGIPLEYASNPKLRYRKPVTLVAELRAHLPGILTGEFQGLFTDEEAAALGDFPFEWFLDLLLGVLPVKETEPIQVGSADPTERMPDFYNLSITERVLRSPLSGTKDIVKGFTHGDFNLNNILIQERTRWVTPWMIDFEKSRSDFYPAYDWAKLEVELALHLAGTHDISFPHLLALERDLWLPREVRKTVGTTRPLAYPARLEKYRRLVEKIRSLAITSLASPQVVDYLFGLVCYAISAIRFVNAQRAGRRLAYIKAVTLLQAILNCLLRKEFQKEAPSLWS